MRTVPASVFCPTPAEKSARPPRTPIAHIQVYDPRVVPKPGRQQVEEQQRRHENDEFHVPSISLEKIFVQRACIMRNSMQLHDWAGLELRHLIALQAVAEE